MPSRCKQYFTTSSDCECQHGREDSLMAGASAMPQQRALDVRVVRFPRDCLPRRPLARGRRTLSKASTTPQNAHKRPHTTRPRRTLPTRMLRGHARRQRPHRAFIDVPSLLLLLVTSCSILALARSHCSLYSRLRLVRNMSTRSKSKRPRTRRPRLPSPPRHLLIKSRSFVPFPRTPRSRFPLHQRCSCTN